MTGGERLTPFDKVVLAAIVANTVVLVWGWVDSTHEEAIDRVHTAFLVFFCLELAVRLRAAGSLRGYLRSGWNVFDSVVIGLALVPALPMMGSFMRLARLARLARIVHSLRHVSHLRVLDYLRLMKGAKS